MMLSDGPILVTVSPGARRIDHVIGIAIEVIMDGKVIKTVANSPSVLKIHRDKKITQSASNPREF